MSGSTIKEFLVGLGFDVDDAGLAKFSAAIASATAVAVALGAAATAMAGAVVAGVKNIAGEYDALDKLAQRYRTTADAVDEFKDIAQVLGLSDAQSDLTAFDRAIADTSIGLGRAKKVFEELGVSVTDAKGKLKPTLDVLGEVQAKLATMERGKQIAIMERLQLDPALLKFFNADLATFKADLEAIDKAAGFDLGEAVEQSKGFMKTWRGMQQEWSKVQIVVTKLYESVAVKLMPVLRDAVDDFRRRLETFRRYVMDNFDGVRKIIGGAVSFVVELARAMWQLLGRAFDLAGDAIKAVVDGLKTMPPELLAATAGVAGLYAAWLLLNSALLASPITWILLLAAALILLWDDYKTWKEGGQSLIDWAQWKTEVDQVTAMIDGFRKFLENAFTLVFAAVDSLTSLLRGDFTGAWRAVGEAVNAVIGIFRTAFDWITKIVDVAAKLGGFGANATGRLGAAIQTAANAQFSTGQFDAMGNPLAGFGAAPAVAGNQTTVNQAVNITVQGSSDPAATGRAVAGEMGRAGADALRNAKGSTR